MHILKKLGKIILVILIVLIVLVLFASLFFKFKSSHYYLFTKTEQAIEEKYTKMGNFKVDNMKIEVDDDTIGTYTIWYPKAIEKESKQYPAMVIANGTGVPASNYSSFFKHLASWGFIVIGNEDQNSRTGLSSEKSLSFLLSENEQTNSKLYHKIDTEKIGIAGHSQGGVGAINAATVQPHHNVYQAIYAVSPTSSFWGQANQLGTDWKYQMDKVTQPVFLAAGTGAFDAGTATTFEETTGQGIAPLWSLEESFEQSPSTIKVMTRKTDIDHGESYQAIDGYMTAWFVWLLQANPTAGKVFLGDEQAELFRNPLYQDTRITVSDNK